MVLSFDTTISVVIAGEPVEYEATVTGAYHAAVKGDSPMSYTGPTPDEAEHFEVHSIQVKVMDRGRGSAIWIEFPHLLTSDEHYEALTDAGIEAHRTARDEALIRRGEEREDDRRLAGNEAGETDA